MRSGPSGASSSGTAVDDLVHDQQARGRELPVTARDADPVVAGDDLGHADDVARLLAEVELVAQRARDLLDERREVDDPVQPPRARRRPDDHLEQREVVLDHLLGLRALDLDHDRVAVGHSRPVHLGDRPGGERLGIDRGEDVLPGHGELALHHRHHLGLGHRRHVRLQGGELGDVLLGDQVGAGREDLAELAEGRPELLERLPQPPRPVRVTLEAQQPPGELADPDRAEDAADLARPGVQPTRVGGLLGGRLAGGRVDDHHRAVGEMGDAIGDVAEQELLATAHPRAADDDDVGIGLVRRRRGSRRRCPRPTRPRRGR